MFTYLYQNARELVNLSTWEFFARLLHEDFNVLPEQIEVDENLHIVTVIQEVETKNKTFVYTVDFFFDGDLCDRVELNEDWY